TVFYAIRGGGTNEAALNRALEGRTAEELDAMRAEFAELARNDTGVQIAFSRAYAYFSGDDLTEMDSEIMNDLGGRAAFDTGQLLKGTPETVEQRRERLHEALLYEFDTGTLGNHMAMSQKRSLQASV